MINEYAALHLWGERHRALLAEADERRQARLAGASRRRTPPASGRRWAWRRRVLPAAHRSRVLRRSAPSVESAS